MTTINSNEPVEKPAKATPPLQWRPGALQGVQNILEAEQARDQSLALAAKFAIDGDGWEPEDVKHLLEILIERLGDRRRFEPLRDVTISLVEQEARSLAA